MHTADRAVRGVELRWSQPVALSSGRNDAFDGDRDALICQIPRIGVNLMVGFDVPFQILLPEKL